MADPGRAASMSPPWTGPIFFIFTKKDSTGGWHTHPPCGQPLPEWEILDPGLHLRWWFAPFQLWFNSICQYAWWKVSWRLGVHGTSAGLGWCSGIVTVWGAIYLGLMPDPSNQRWLWGTLHPSDKTAQAMMDAPWLWNLWAESSEVRNRGYWWQHNIDLSPMKILKKSFITNSFSFYFTDVNFCTDQSEQ